jgi:hypothetical protein
MKEDQMLRDGKFIKEDPIKIGAYYHPSNQQQPTPEDEFVQELILCGTPDPQSIASTRSAKLLDWILFVLLVWLMTAALIPAVKFIADHLL